MLSGENPLFNLFLKEESVEEKVRKIIGDSLNDLNLRVDSVVYEKENGHNYLRICLDSDDTIDLDLIVKATNIINPLMDKEDIIKEEYHLDIYGKSKGN